MNLLKKTIKFGSGVVLAQLITAASIPLLARLYTPEEFSLFGMYFSLASVLLVFVTLKLETILPKEKDISIKLPIINTVSLITFIPLSLVSFSIICLIDNDVSFKNLIFSILVVIAAIVFNFFNAISILNIRQNKINLINRARVSRSFLAVLFQIIFSFMKGGLFLGEFFGRVIGLSILSHKENYNFKFRQAIDLIKEKFNYIQYVVLGGFFNTLGLNLYPIIVLKFYDPILIGKFFFIQKILSSPVTIFAQSISMSLLGDFNKIVEKDKNSLVRKMNKISILLFIFSLIGFLSLAVLLGKWDSYIFGNNWSGISVYVYILTPFLVGQVSFSPFSQLLILFGGEKKQFIWDLVRLLFVLISIFAPFYIDVDNNFEMSLLIYSISNFFMYLLHYLILVNSILRFKHV